MTETYHDKLYIDGAWVSPMGEITHDVINSTTEEVMGRVPDGTHADVDRAVAAARRAFDDWSASDPADRAKLLRGIAEGLEARQEEIGTIIAQEVGMPLKLAIPVQAGNPMRNFANTAQILDEFVWSETIGNAEIVKEPIGVVGAITPWNFPLHQISLKVAPALATGCTIVVKPTEIAPLTSFILAEIIDEIGLPAGVFNLVSGTGPIAGEALAGHEDVDMVSFTGSTRAGKRVAELCAETVKRVHLELGGKSANVILDDADFDSAVRAGVGNAFFNSGQTCAAQTRMLVPRDRLAEVEEIAAETAGKFTPGDPLGDGRIGPLISATQRDRVRTYINQGVDEGARLVTGGVEAPDDLDAGYFVRPTVFSDVTSDMTIAQEEIFGPVLSIMPYDGEDDAVDIANDTVYGLSGGVWSDDEQRARRVARRIRTGDVSINGGGYNPLAPFGGYKQSGLGREAGRHGFEAYLETKALLT